MYSYQFWPSQQYFSHAGASLREGCIYSWTFRTKMQMGDPAPYSGLTIQPELVFVKYCAPAQAWQPLKVYIYRWFSSISWPSLMLLANSYNSFWDILITRFQCPNLQRQYLEKKQKKKLFFKKHCYNTSLNLLISSISWPCLKLLAIIVFVISWLQVF